jgi:hypothetical protein
MARARFADPCISVLQEVSVILGRLGLAALVLASLVGIVRADDKDAPKTDAVDFRKLKELMPAELNGLKRSDISGEKNKAGNMSISHMTAKFKGGDANDSPVIQVEILDYSNMEMAKGLSAAWTALEIDKESDAGFDKTIKVAGNPGLETWRKEPKHGEVQLLVGQRYIVSVKTDNIPAEQVIKVVEALPLDKLAALK